MRRKASVTVRGKCHEWCVDSDMKQAQIDAMREDGVDVGVVYYSIPEWAVACGLTRPWFFVQDVFNFRNPFAS